MRCKVCNKGPMDGVTVFRQNKKGEPGVWACEEHSKPIDPALYRDVAAVEAANPGLKRH